MCVFGCARGYTHRARGGREWASSLSSYLLPAPFPAEPSSGPGHKCDLGPRAEPGRSTED